MADVQKRMVTKPEDLLPIIANCYNYWIRRNPEVVKTRKISLSLALLMQALLNGEVRFNNADLDIPSVLSSRYAGQRKGLGVPAARSL